MRTINYQAMDVSEFKHILTKVENIDVSEHVTDPKKGRDITKEEVLTFIRNKLEKLDFIEEQNSLIGQKYRLIFNRSNVYYLNLICVLKDEQHLNVVTAYISNKKKIRLNEAWKRKHT